jgi:Glycosyl transferase family 11
VIAVNLTGGLGNQLFSYAVGRKLALLNNTTLHLCIGDYLKNWSRRFQLDEFNIEAELNYGRRGFRHLIKIKDLRSELNHNITGHEDNLFLDGYWQSPYYFADIRGQLINDLSLRKSLDKNNIALLNQINSTNSVCVHVRRGDYASLKKTNFKYGNICTNEYYINAVQHLNQYLENPVYYVFSDEPDWVKRNLDLPCNFISVEENKGKKLSKFGNNYFVRNSMVFFKYLSKDNSFADFELMRNCKNFIIANSTFSWWAAWISENPDKIICCPPKWSNINTEEENLFYDLLIPSSWIRISSVLDN